MLKHLLRATKHVLEVFVSFFVFFYVVSLKPSSTVHCIYGFLGGFKKQSRNTTKINMLPVVFLCHPLVFDTFCYVLPGSAPGLPEMFTSAEFLPGSKGKII